MKISRKKIDNSDASEILSEEDALKTCRVAKRFQAVDS